MALASPIHPRRPTWDVIVVGARCAGSPTAMLLARAGFRVLLIDRAHFPSDSMRCHFIQRTGIEYLTRWGLLPRVAASGCPPIFAKNVDLGDFSMPMPPETGLDFPAHYAPRRYVLDAILVDAAAEAGASMLQGCAVHDLIWEDGRVAGVRGRTAGGVEIVERAAHRRRRRRDLLARRPVRRRRHLRRASRRDVLLLQLLRRCSGRRRRDHFPRRPLRRRVPHQRGVDRRRRRRPHRRVPQIPRRYRARVHGDLTEDAVAGGPGRGRRTSRALVRHRRSARLLPPIARSGLGVGRRRRPPQGPDPRQRHQRRLPQRRPARRGDRDRLLRTDVARTGAGRVRADAGTNPPRRATRRPMPGPRSRPSRPRSTRCERRCEPPRPNSVPLQRVRWSGSSYPLVRTGVEL